MRSFMDDLALLEEPIPLNDIDPQNYPDVPAVPPPPAAGNYRLKANYYGLKKKDGVLVKYNNYPVFTLQTVEIVEPLDAARKVKIWHDVKTEPFLRNGRGASQLMDLQRALDQTRSFSEVNQGLALVGELLADGREFNAKLDWQAYDGNYVNEQFAQVGGKQNLSKDQINAIYNKAKLTSMWQFPKKADGTYSNIWGGVDGTQAIEARPYIARFFASLDHVKFGPARS